MSEPLVPMTKEDLEKQVAIPDVHKKAIEHAIWEGIDPDDPEDKVWPDYYRADQVNVLRGLVLSEDDDLFSDEYVDECMWFSGGWKARENMSV